MYDEYIALIKNKTWTLVPRPKDVNIVRCMWLLRHKYVANATLSRYKNRFVTNGSTQLEGIYVDETFSPVVKPDTIRTVLSLDTSRHWPVDQLDVKNAFLHDDLSKTVYMHQPPRFRDSTHPDYVCLLQRQGADTAYLLLYVDDIVLIASSEVLLQMFLSQRKYAAEILERAYMVNCNPWRTHVDTESKLGYYGDLVFNPTLYRSLADSLQYLTFTRPDISYAVQHGFVFGVGAIPIGVYRMLSALEGQLTLSRSSAEAEYRGVVNAIAETCWLRNLLHLVADGEVRVLHVPSRYKYADIFTKGLPSALFEEFRTSLSVWCPPAQTAGEC
ncbi:ribonuclease H-like domain-containing protein [Tanacetum coccineum]